MEFRKYLFQTIITVTLGIMSFIVKGIYSDVKTNTSFSIQHTRDIKTITERVENLEKNYNSMPDVYVTRRELNIILGNIDTKVDNIKTDVNAIGSDVKDINNKFDRLMEKIYEKN